MCIPVKLSAKKKKIQQKREEKRAKLARENKEKRRFRYREKIFD